MGIFDRLKTVISSNMNDLISKAENPEKMLNQMIIEMNEQLIDSKKAVAMAIADEKRLEREVTENRAKAEEWEKKAMLAVRAGRDDLAKEALMRKQEHESYVGQLGTQWQAQKESVEKLKESLRGLQTKIEEASRKKNILIARAKRAEAQDKINKTMSSLQGSKSAFDTFDRMAKKIDELEARAEAQKELEDVSSGASLDKQFAALESSPAAADALLEDLKRKMLTEDAGNGGASDGAAGSSA
ncbi:MAG: PspA/IM30 family protein [Spirochaetia bacterium]|nr:PspA/IM30 family protein [Spirochaetia bacterium]MCE1209372.1 PspA/IM30 family protein [Spirochaetia bacterium]